MNTKAAHFKHLTLILDALLSAGVWLLAVHFAVVLGAIAGDAFYAHAALVVAIVPLQLWACYRYAAYGLSLRETALYAVKSTATVGLAVIAFLFVADLSQIHRGVVLTFLLVTPLVMVFTKYFLRLWYFQARKERVENYTKILIVGSGPRAHDVVGRMQRAAEWGTQIIGFIDPHGGPSQIEAGHLNGYAEGLKIKHVSEVQQILSENVVDEVVIALPRKYLSDVQELARICEAEGVCIKFAADIFDIEPADVRMSTLEGLPLLEFYPVAQNLNMLIVKRIFDLIATIAATPLLIPLFAIVALAVRLDSKGPVFFSQTRIGLNKRPFRMFKFRSMYEDAEARLAEIEHLNEASGPNFKIANDPRVTRVGKFIRKTSLDELPQLINVFMGQMSLVGPRPMSVRDVNYFDKSAQRRRFSVRPGVTCTWQISGRSNLSFDEWLALDLSYIDNWKFTDDLVILLKTIPSVLKGSGAV